MPEGKARTDVLHARVRRAAAEAFRAKAKERGLSVSDALRQAMGLWMKGK
jgi:hypothetical protein